MRAHDWLTYTVLHSKDTHQHKNFPPTCSNFLSNCAPSPQNESRGHIRHVVCRPRLILLFRDILRLTRFDPWSTSASY